jgi:predicted cupin superfamily sugar epimerase
VDADDIIAALRLEPHPEGGYFRETFRDTNEGARDHSTAIYYLLRKGERSHWHRVDAAEVWHHYAGGPLELSIAEDGAEAHTIILGTSITKGERPQAVVPKGAWQSARPLGEFTLTGCTVAPGFDFAGFEMAPPDWEPGA